MQGLDGGQRGVAVARLVRDVRDVHVVPFLEGTGCAGRVPADVVEFEWVGVGYQVALSARSQLPCAMPVTVAGS